jgi:hypothetical protein
VSAGLLPELGILYENGGSVALGVKGGVAVAIDGVGPLCDVVAPIPQWLGPTTES